MRLRLAGGIAAFAAQVPILRQVPSPASGFEAMPWGHAVPVAALQAALFGLHCALYARWHPASPRRLEANEALARAWMVLFGLLVVAGHSARGPAFLGAAAAWGALSLLVERGLLRRDGRYDAAGHFLLWGLFLLGQALLGLAALKA